jgi:hypothetical protein
MIDRQVYKRYFVVLGIHKPMKLQSNEKKNRTGNMKTKYDKITYLILQ